MTLKDAQTKALEVKKLYDELNKKSDQGVWQPNDYLAGLVGDVGDLHKLVMAHNHKRTYKGKDKTLDEAIGHELSDILWSVMVLANFYGTDLDQAFAKTMDELKASVSEKLKA